MGELFLYIMNDLFLTTDYYSVFTVRMLQLFSLKRKPVLRVCFGICDSKAVTVD